MTAASAAPRRPRIFERHPRLTLAALALVGVVATDVAFTQAYTWLMSRRAAGRVKLRIKSPVYHHSLAPLVSDDDEPWGPSVYPYRTNSLGFRDRATREVPLRSDRHRIVFMGDSFTEGVGVPYEKTFVGIVDETLGKRGVEVLNGGLSLCSPVIYSRKTQYLLENVGLRFDEMVVFLDISDIQDEVTFDLDAQGNVDLLQRRRRLEEKANWQYSSGFWRLHRLERFLDDHTLLLIRLYKLVERPFANPLHRGAAWTYDAKVFEEYGREGLEKARRNMDALHALLAPRGIRLTVVVYPWPDQILVGDRDSRQVRFWRAWAETKGVGFVDLFPDFIGRGKARETVAQYFIPGDIHWNEAGHRLVAESFLQRFEPR